MKHFNLKHRIAINGIAITAVLLWSTANGKESHTKGKAQIGQPGIAEIAKLKPDFGIVSVKKAHSSGPKSIYRYGGCDSELKVIAKNSGDDYKPGLKYDFRSNTQQSAGSVNVTHYQKQSGYFIFGRAELGNEQGKWSKGQNSTKLTTVRFQRPGVYQIQTTIQACTRAGACIGLAEKNQQDNNKTFRVEVKEPCLVNKTRG